MAEQSVDQVLPIAPFPAPPPFWKHFNSTNLTRFETLNDEAASNDALLDPETLPPELQVLLPPPPPSDNVETYTTFNQTHIVNPTSALSATANIPAEDLANLFITPGPMTNIPAALTSLTNSLLLTFLQLTHTLSLDPTHESRYELLEHMKNVLVNIHVLINSYRPHQAREGVVNMLKDRIDAVEAEIRQSDEMKRRVEDFLKGLQEAQLQDEQDDGRMVKTAASREAERNKRMWAMICEMDAQETSIQDG